MRTTTKPPRKEKMVPFPASLDRRATLALHALEGIPDEKLRDVAALAPGERLRALTPDGPTWGTGAPLAPEGIVYSLAPRQRMGVETLCRRTGLDQYEVARLLVSAGLFVVGLDLPGEPAFRFLLEAAVGEKRFKEATTDGADVNGLELAQLAADREAEERLEARPYLAASTPKPRIMAEA